MAVRAILARAGRVAAVISNVNSNRYSTASALAEAVVEHVEVPAWRGPSKATPVVAPTKIVAEPSAATAALMQLERTYGANNYKARAPGRETRGPARSAPRHAS